MYKLCEKYVDFTVFIYAPGAHTTSLLIVLWNCDMILR